MFSSVLKSSNLGLGLVFDPIQPWKKIEKIPLPVQVLVMDVLTIPWIWNPRSFKELVSQNTKSRETSGTGAKT